MSCAAGPWLAPGCWKGAGRTRLSTWRPTAPPIPWRCSPLPTLRTLAYGGAPMPVRVIEKALARWPEVGFVSAYGLTETSSTVAILGPEEHRLAVASADPRVRARLASAGRVIPAVELRVLDPGGNQVPPGTFGRICEGFRRRAAPGPPGTGNSLSARCGRRRQASHLPAAAVRHRSVRTGPDHDDLGAAFGAAEPPAWLKRWHDALPLT